MYSSDYTAIYYTVIEILKLLEVQIPWDGGVFLKY